MYIQTLTVAAAIGLSGLALSVNNGDPGEPKPGANITAPAPPASPQVLARGREMFLVSCAPCHGAMEPVMDRSLLISSQSRAILPVVSI